MSQSKTIRNTSNTTVALPIPTIPSAVVSQRTTRVTPNPTVIVPFALDSEVFAGLSTITTAIVPSTQISRTSLRARSAAVIITPNSRMTWNQDKRGTSEEPIEIDDNFNQDQSMEDFGNSTATEESESNECHPDDSESDDSDDGHLTDNARDDTPSVDPTSDNIAPDIVHYTSGDNSVVDSTSRSNLASILQKTSLFNDSELRWQQGDLASKRILMRQQYRSRKPSVQNVLPKPSLLKLPETNGPIIVEELLQLGERCQWITQKHEAIKGYLRALDEHLLLTMLGVEQLFDSRYLKRLFKCRRSGAGICTKRLMDKVEEMVRKSMENSKAGDTCDETFQFNVKEILGSQYQAKFCVSVEVTIKPYDGKNEYLHMAQHFREVCDVFRERADIRWHFECFLPSYYIETLGIMTPRTSSRGRTIAGSTHTNGWSVSVQCR